MKKSLCLICILALFCACSKQSETKKEQSDPKTEFNTEDVYSFDIKNLPIGCSENSEVVCSINNYIKCTINPRFSDCVKNKDFMPDFVFMEDENLQRPTIQSYKILKLKPLSNGKIEVYTQSTCNGNWFGLCNGNIIYVMESKENQWNITEVYAIEN